MHLVGDIALVFGGADSDHNVAFDDTWQGTYSTHGGHSLYVFGGILVAGGGTSAPVNDLWVLDVASCEWSPIATNVRPPARTASAAVSTATHLVLFGGLNAGAMLPVMFNDVWVLDFVTRAWSEVAASSSSVMPSPRFSHSMTAVTVGGEVHAVVYGGRCINGPNWDIVDDVWMLSLATVPTYAKCSQANNVLQTNQATWSSVKSIPWKSNRILADAVVIGSHVWFFGGVQPTTVTGGTLTMYNDSLAAPTTTLPRELAFGDDNDDLVTDAIRHELKFDRRHQRRWVAITIGQLLVFGGRAQGCLGDLWMRTTTEPPTYSSSSGRSAESIATLVVTIISLIVLIPYIFCLAVKLFAPPCWPRRVDRPSTMSSSAPVAPTGVPVARLMQLPRIKVEVGSNDRA
ncbi:hypothetical protein ACHHYP_09430 [Achlya hypogyna]|uniref:Uncharacterized protein n=1 Tax=Achlya hypogyna TaxID=1202772 RepID=A0A1V9ZIU1_ACHHY|nr:hypothetical protein ACHHYP_09430 [Achlya hypogyna]